MKKFTKEEQEKIEFIYKEIIEMMREDNLEFSEALGAAEYLWKITEEIEEALWDMYSEDT